MTDGTRTGDALIVAGDIGAAARVRRCLAAAGVHCAPGFADARRTGLDGRTAELVVVDDSAPRAVLLARIAELRAARPRATVLVLAADMAGDWPAQTAAAGADAAIRRQANDAATGALVRALAAGDVVPAPRARRPTRDPRAPRLTAREREILELVAGGASNGVIASRLWLAEQTVKFHLSNVYRKLGVANRTQASRYAYEHGLLELDGSTTTRPAFPAAA